MAFPKIEGYVVTEKLGSGSYSTVYKAYTKVGARSVVAIKCVDKSRIKHSGSAVDNLVTEIRLLKTLTHPHIVHMKNFTWDDKNIYIIMEYCCGGDLSKYIHKYGRIPESRVLYFLQQLASALKYLREKGVVHMDLKPHNLLLHKSSDGKLTLKVADFGFAAHLTPDDTMSSVRGSPLYMAPEMLLQGRHDARVDLWSVDNGTEPFVRESNSHLAGFLLEPEPLFAQGVIMYECLFGRAPYSSNTFAELVEKIKRQAPIQLPPNANISPGCADLVTRLLQHDPDARISYEEFFQHEYLDLEHMPSKENYEKAVSLLTSAIDADVSGRPAAALRLYTRALRLLVPSVRALPDTASKNLLNCKLNKYMQRAEQLKEYLKSGSSVPQMGAEPTRPLSPVVSACCTAQEDGTANSYDFSNIRKSGGNTPVSKETETVGRVEQPAISDDEDEQPSNTRGGAPGLLRRLFTKNRSISIPYLDAREDGLNNENQKTRSDNNDGCRIT